MSSQQHSTTVKYALCSKYRELHDQLFVLLRKRHADSAHIELGDVDTGLVERVSKMSRLEVASALKTCRQLIIQASRVHFENVCLKLTKTAVSFQATKLSKVVSDEKLDATKNKSFLRGLKNTFARPSSVIIKTFVDEQENPFDVKPPQQQLRRASTQSDISFDSEVSEDALAHHQVSADDGATFFVLDTLRLCLEENKTELKKVPIDTITFLMNELFSLNTEDAIIVSAIQKEAGKCLEVITSSTHSFNMDLCDMVESKWKDTCEIVSGTTSPVFIAFLRKIPFLHLHITQPAMILSLLDSIWSKAAHTDRSAVRTEVCNAINKLLQNMGLAEDGDIAVSITEEWMSFMTAPSKASERFSIVLEEIYLSVLKWIKKDKWQLIRSCQTLCRTILLLQPQSFRMLHLESWIDSVVRHMKPERGTERSEALKLLNSVYISMPDSSIRESADKLFETLKYAIVTLISGTRKKSPMTDEEISYLTTSVNHVYKASGSIELLLKFVKSFLCTEKTSVLVP